MAEKVEQEVHDIFGIPFVSYCNLAGVAASHPARLKELTSPLPSSLCAACDAPTQARVEMAQKVSCMECKL